MYGTGTIVEEETGADQADIPYKGLYGEALPEKGDCCRLHAFRKGAGFKLKFMKGLWNLSFRYLKGPLMNTFRTDGS